jgi:hypothetical protein
MVNMTLFKPRIDNHVVVVLSKRYTIFRPEADSFRANAESFESLEISAGSEKTSPSKVKSEGSGSRFDQDRLLSEFVSRHCQMVGL